MRTSLINREEVEMNQLLDKLERKIGRYAIRNLSLYLIVGYVIGYILSFTGTMDFLNFDVYQISQGQIWRIITWILMPPISLSGGFLSIISVFFLLWIFYSFGSALERSWGSFKFNVYIISGLLFTMIGATLFYLYCVFVAKVQLDPSIIGRSIAGSISTYYIYLTVFMAFATCYPDIKLLLYFIIPIKIKWLAILDAVLLLYNFIVGGTSVKVVIASSFLNFLLFFLTSGTMRRFRPKEVHRRTEFKRQHTVNTTNITKHKCAICGRTEKDGDQLEFRFCSKCNGNYEYCQDHLFTHEHVK